MPEVQGPVDDHAPHRSRAPKNGQFHAPRLRAHHGRAIFQKTGIGYPANAPYLGNMAGQRGQRERAAEKIIKLASTPADVVSLWRQTTEVLAEAVPHFWAPCFYTLDPASLLITSHFHDGMPEFPASMLADEYYTSDVNQLADVATSATGVSTLHEATGGHPSAALAGTPIWPWAATRSSSRGCATARARSGEC